MTFLSEQQFWAQAGMDPPSADPNAADDAADMTEVALAERVASGQRFRDFLDSLPEAQARARTRSSS